MSDLVYQNYNNRCQGWSNPSSFLFGPQIISLSNYQSPAGSSTLISINGNNFYSYSSIRFGTFTPTTYFINSNLLEFYVPNTLIGGTFPIQVFNGSFGSNIVMYTVDASSGYWLLNTNNKSIINTNTNGVNVSWFSRGTIVQVDNSSGTYNSPPGFVIQDNQNWIVCDGGSDNNDIYITLPSDSTYDGREIMFRTNNANIYSSENNILSLNNTQTDYIVSSDNGGSWSTLVYQYSELTWIVMQANWNNP
jgi:hypothetical protein